MPLELRKQRDGVRFRPYWYGRFETDGKRSCVKLCPWEGKPPPSLAEAGDKDFEKSRAKALSLLAVKIEQAREKRDAQHWVKRLHELQTGESIQAFPVANLVQAWKPRGKPSTELHPRYLADVHATLRRFIDFMRTRYPKAQDVGQVSPTMAGAFIEEESSRGKKGQSVSAKTRNDSLKRLRKVFRDLVKQNIIARNPFDWIELHKEHHVHRRPLTPAEIAKVLKAAEDDDLTRPLFVCALSTAMRRGDCCCLKWSDVHLDETGPDGHPVPAHVTVKTSKTGETVTAPVDGRLKAELLVAKDGADESGYVWPEAARMLKTNPDGVTKRVQQAFAKAGLGDAARHAERTRGVRRASVVDFHSLRTTWITDKLSAGVPIEAVKLTSGHRTTEVVTEHYFKPGVKQHLDALNGGGVSPVVDRNAEMRTIVRNMTARTLKADKARLLALLEGKG